jgi:hypothetical protein
VEGWRGEEDEEGEGVGEKYRFFENWLQIGQP